MALSQVYLTNVTFPPDGRDRGGHTMTFLQIYLINGAVSLGQMVTLWLASLRPQNASIVDIFWGTGFVISSWVYCVLTTAVGTTPREWVLAILVTIWGLRLSLYILWRNWGKPKTFAIARGASNTANAGGGSVFSKPSCCKGS
jgi:steroid 5-alpha reductase family enzyme